MGMPVTSINSSQSIDIDLPFRVSAGPGAGKTYWLISHMKNILKFSSRLGKCRKIACITYTNVGVDTLTERLGKLRDRVEVSTIHSFLYKHIVKPYSFILERDFGLLAQRVDGHEDHVVSKKKVISWLNAHPHKSSLKPPFNVNQLSRMPENTNRLCNWLQSIYYDFEKESLKPTCRNSASFAENSRIPDTHLNILSKDLLNYKKLYWAEGKVHHDDVLFFSHHILKSQPFVLDVLRAKFPYFFIDEFQDTSPIQTWIIRQIASIETVVGVIGDSAQSIYSFQGAKPIDFSTFAISGLMDYVIPDNRRSSVEIIKLLNHIRKDIAQSPVDVSNSDKPIIILGSSVKAYNFAKERCLDEPLHCLSRRNLTSSEMKNGVDGLIMDEDFHSEFLAVDKPSSDNLYRSRIILSCLYAIELAVENNIYAALKEVEKNIRGLDKSETRKKSLNFLSLSLECYSKLKSESLMGFYAFVKANVRPDLTDLKSGKRKDFYDTHSYEDLSKFLNVSEDSGLFRTIHKSKGAEFENVFVVISDLDVLSVFDNPNLVSNEEERVYYVAFSRAKKRLFISIPEPSDTTSFNLLHETELIELVKLES